MMDSNREKEKIDLEIVPQVNVLKAQIDNLNNEAWDLLSAPGAIQDRIRARAEKMDDLKAGLK